MGVLKKIIITLVSWVFMLKLIPLRFVELLGQLFPEDAAGCKIRGWLYKPFLKRCGTNFQVSLRVKLENLNKIEIGNDVYIGHGSWINGDKDGVILNDEVMLGPYVTMVAGNHGVSNGSYRFGKGTGGRIQIGRGTWLASKSTVVAGVTLGEGTLVAANCVVVKDYQDNVKLGGVPSQIIGN